MVACLDHSQENVEIHSLGDGSKLEWQLPLLQTVITILTGKIMIAILPINIRGERKGYYKPCLAIIPDMYSRVRDIINFFTTELCM